MTIPFLPAQDRQRYILGIFAVCVLLGGGVFWYGYVREGSLPLFKSEPPPLPEEVDINFAIFNDPGFLELGEPGPPISLPNEIGKRNPFLLEQESGEIIEE